LCWLQVQDGAQQLLLGVWHIWEGQQLLAVAAVASTAAAAVDILCSHKLHAHTLMMLLLLPAEAYGGLYVWQPCKLALKHWHQSQLLQLPMMEVLWPVVCCGCKCIPGCLVLQMRTAGLLLLLPDAH
jgi:hypothetical protein